jgi:flagellar basal body rod protein FlgB
MQATINQKDKEIRELKQELKATKEERVLILYEIEQERHNIVDLEKENSKLVVEKYDLETALSICNNRIKYEFRGE